MVRVHFRSLALVLLFPASLSVADEPSFVPSRLNAYIGGRTGSSYFVKLRDGALLYTTSRNRKSVVITPSEEQWREFRGTLDELKVWRWRASYPNERVRDGTSWSLEIAYADRRLKASGHESYPDIAGRPAGMGELPDGTREGPPGAFKRYLAAVRRLIGGKQFQ